MTKHASTTTAPSDSEQQQQQKQQQQQSFVWFAPSTLYLDVVDDAATFVSFVRGPSSDTAKPTVRLSYSVTSKADSSSTVSHTESFADGTASLSLRTASSAASSSSSSSFLGALLKLGQSSPRTIVRVTVEIADACQAGLNIVVRGSKRTHVDFKDEFVHPFGDIDVSFVSTHKLQARIEFGLNTVGQKHEFMALSLMTRSFKLDGSSQDILIAGDLSASQTVSIATGSGSIKCGKITAASDGGVLVQSSSGDMEIGGIFGTSAGIRSSSGYVTLAGPVAVVGAFKIETTSGDVKCKDIIQANTLSIRTSSGFIKMTTAVCDSATLNTTSGDVDASTIETRNADLTIHTSSGYIRMGDLVVGGSLQFNTTSGDIRLNDITARGHVKLSSSSGSVSAATVWARSLECGSTSGNCKIASVNAVDTVDIKTSSGDLVVQVDFVGDDLTAGERAASLRSTSGDIRGSAVRHYKSAAIRSSSSNVGIQLAPLAGSTTTVNSTSGDVFAKVAAGYHGTVSVRSHNDSSSARQAGVTLSRGSNFQIVVGESKETMHHSKMDFAGSSSKITVEFA